MCQHCGCRAVGPIGELMDEHDHLLDSAQALRQALANGDRSVAAEIFAWIVEHLGIHARREEQGIFAALRDTGEYLEEVDALEGEHASFDADIKALDVFSADFEPRVNEFLRNLDHHVERENLGIFPVSVVTLGAAGWQKVQEARELLPTFLNDRA